MNYLSSQAGVPDVKVCLFRNITGIPCPACGSSRAVEHLLYGEIRESVLMNPFGIIISIIMIALPLWLLHDLLFRKCTLYSCFRKTNSFLGKKTVIFLLIFVVLSNWIWNIVKFINL